MTPLTPSERSLAEQSLRRAARPPLSEALQVVVACSFVGFAVLAVGTQSVMAMHPGKEPLPVLLACMVAVIGGALLAGAWAWWFIRKNWRELYAWDVAFLTELLASPELVRHRVKVRRLAILRDDADDPRPAGHWMFAELEDGRILSVGGSGPICLDQPVRPCREFELVAWPERGTYAFFHPLGPDVKPDLVLRAEFWDALAIRSGTILDPGWDHLPEVVRRASARRQQEEMGATPA